MSGVITATVVVGLVTANQQKVAADKARRAQQASAQAGIDTQKEQWQAAQEIMSPYVGAGQEAMGGQQALLGLKGPEAQQAAIAAIQNSPQFGAITQQGENAMLQNASATGGLRGGNIQASLAQFRPRVLSQLIDQQYGRLGQLATLGQASAAGQAAQGMQLGTNLSNQYTQIGQAQAGQAMANGQANAQLAGTMGNAFGQIIGKF